MSEREIRLVAPGTPPSVNHYKQLRVVGGRVRTFVTREAVAFLDAIALCAAGVAPLPRGAYAVRVCVYQGKGEKGDIDNYAKCVLDGLVKAGVLPSDAAVTELHLEKRRDRDHPRTEIAVRLL